MLAFVGTLTGQAVYHVIAWVGIAVVAGLVWLEWRRSNTEESRTRLIAVTVMLTAHAFALLVLPLQTDPSSALYTLTAPVGHAVDALCAVLVVWTFVSHNRLTRPYRVLRILLIGWGTLLILAVITWAVPGWGSGAIYAQSSWQVAWWYGITALAAVAGIVFLKPRSQPVPMSLFAGVLLGSLAGLLGSQTAGQILAHGDAWAQVMYQITFILYAFALYSTVLHAIDSRYHELVVKQEQTEAQRGTLTALMNASRIMGGSYDLDIVLSDTAHLIARALKADAVVLATPRDSRLVVFNVAARYARSGQVAGLSMRLDARDDVLLQRVLAERQAVSLDGRQTRTVRWLPEATGLHAIGALWVQPLMFQETLAGLILICRESSKTPFTIEDQRWLELMGEQVAATMHNIQSYRTLARQGQELSANLESRDTALKRETAILESMAEGVLVADMDGRFIMVNRAAEEILDVKRDALLGRTAQEALRSSALQGGLSVRTVHDMKGPYETVALLGERRIRVRAAPLLLREGEKLGVVAVLQDITREFQSERAKQDFIASISSELRTPLTAIKGYTELMHNGTAGVVPPMFQEFLGLIRENTTRMTALTNNIIAVAEIERGGIALHIMRSNIRDVLQNVLSQYNVQIKDKQIRLKMAMQDIPMIDMDSNRIRLVIDNLLSNAVKFTPAGGTITVGCESMTDSLSTASFIRVWISDTGPGLTLENQVMIWQSFYRVNNTLTMDSGGLGIGLTIVKGLVEAHGGRVWVDSTPGQGCTFNVMLPVLRSPSLQETLAAMRKYGGMP